MNAIFTNPVRRVSRLLQSPFRAQPPSIDPSAVERINAIVETLQRRSDENLRLLADRLRGEIRTENRALDGACIELGFAIAVDAIRRTLGLRLYDVQLLGGLVMAHGMIAEMQTGEGKTLTIGPVAFLHSLSGQGVHVATTNAYLAERDYQALRDAFALIGATCGLLKEQHEFQASHHAYRQDITYGTGYQFGFDYLRDQVTLTGIQQPVLGRGVMDTLSGKPQSVAPLLQRGLHFAIIDEIDSVLIDEAGTPLVLSGANQRVDDSAAFIQAREVANSLAAGVDFSLDPATRQIDLRPSGFAKISRTQQQLTISRPWINYVRNALFARYCVHRDIDYVVREEKVQIVDQNTGRIFDDRTWRDGLHQAVEAKEQVAISEANSSVARITRQRYFQHYDQCCGLTGTIQGNETEMRRFYGLHVQVIPSRKPSLRAQLPTRFFADQASRLNALMREIRARHSTGQPILIGTRTITQSKEISVELAKAKLPHILLNGVQDENESSIIARAGKRGAITVATNMAGRGTDIKLTADSLACGGLHVIGVEQNFSPRIDRQLIGRCARQGDPGSCQFFVSAEDDLIIRHRPPLGRRIARTAQATGESNSDFNHEISAVQRLIEQAEFEKRKMMVQRDAWADSVLETFNKEV